MRHAFALPLVRNALRGSIIRFEKRRTVPPVKVRLAFSPEFSQPNTGSWRLLVILVFIPPQNLESTLHELAIAPKDHQNLTRARINCN